MTTCPLLICDYVYGVKLLHEVLYNLQAADDRLRNVVLGEHCLSPNDGIVKYPDYMCWYVVALGLFFKDFHRRDVDCSHVHALLLLIGKGGINMNLPLKELAAYITELFNWASHLPK
jgi:hypothetical protein